jgi:hypothetical protein
MDPVNTASVTSRPCLSAPRRLPWICVGALIAVIQGCATPAQTNQLIAGAALGTWYASRSPSQELEQIYYLGVFDPNEQLPDAIYRLTVKGQASALSGMKFGSGWVPAPLVDSLGSTVGFAEGLKGTGPELTCNAGIGCTAPDFKAGRTLVLFGPEGFRVAPKGQRLVVVMGASPDAFFQAIDQVVGRVAKVELERDNSNIKGEIFQALLDARDQRNRLSALELQLERASSK